MEKNAVHKSPFLDYCFSVFMLCGFPGWSRFPRRTWFSGRERCWRTRSKGKTHRLTLNNVGPQWWLCETQYMFWVPVCNRESQDLMGLLGYLAFQVKMELLDLKWAMTKLVHLLVCIRVNKYKTWITCSRYCMLSMSMFEQCKCTHSSLAGSWLNLHVPVRKYIHHSHQQKGQIISWIQ